MKKITSLAKFLLPLVLFIVIAASAVTSTRAQDPTLSYTYLPVIKTYATPRWIGPVGGSVTVLITDPANTNVLYAGTQGNGVFKTTNGGTNWSKANNGISTFTVNSLAIDPKNVAILYVGTEGQNGVYKSTDGGSTWNISNNGIKANSNVLALAVNPGNSDLVYAGTQTLGTSDGVLYKSTNSGSTWTAVLSLAGNWVNSLAINPKKPYILLAATQNNGPYFAGDYGPSGAWGPTNTSPGDWKTSMWVGFDPKSGTDRAYHVSKGNDFYDSTNNGINWTHQYDGPGSTVISRNALAINPFSLNRFYLATSSSDVAGVLRSDDWGQNWRASGLQGKKVNTVVVSRANADTIFAGTDPDGVFKSTDGGTTWSLSSTGLGSSYVTGMTFSGNSIYFAGTYGGGVLKSINAGTTWTAYNTNLSDRLINGLVQHPTQSKIIYALTASSGLLWNDISGSAGWLPVTGLPQAFDKQHVALHDDPTMAAATTAVGVNAMVFAPSDANIAYLATNGGGVYASTNSGVSFAPKGLAGEVVKSITVNSTDVNTIYVATSIKGVVKKSALLNGALYWNSMALPNSEKDQTVNAVAMWPGAPDSVTAGTSNGVWIYNGSSWEAAGLQGYTVNVLTPDPFTLGFMIAGTNRGTFVSLDHKNWTPIDSSMGTLNVASVNFNPAEPGLLYIGTADRGALRISNPN